MNHSLILFRLTDYTGSTEFPLVSPDEMIMESTTGDMMYKEMFVRRKVHYTVYHILYMGHALL